MLELRESGPTGSEVRDEAIGSRVGQHTFYFGAQLGIGDWTVAGGKVEQSLVGGAAPEECGEAADEFEVLHVLRRFDIRVKQETGVGEHRHEQIPKGIDLGFGVFQCSADECGQFLAFSFRQGTAPSPLGERLHSCSDGIVIQFAAFHEWPDAGRWPLPGQVELDAFDHGVARVLHDFLVDGRLASRGVVTATVGRSQPVLFGEIGAPCVGPAVVGPDEVGVSEGHPVLVGYRFIRG